MPHVVLERMCDLIQADPGRRGLRTDPNSNLITACVGDFAAACQSIADSPAPAIAVVTGFFIPLAQPPAGETDGPLGALFLARALVPAGIRVALVTDHYCETALREGLRGCGLTDRVPLVILSRPGEAWDTFIEETWQRQFLRAFPLTHLVALERVGPSHTPESIRLQPGVTPERVDCFQREVPVADHDRCHSMRGRDITDLMSPAHRLFESARQQSPPWTTIGIGDGGNEIGMGKIPWDVIRRNIPRGATVACRVPVDHLIVCGISNWGAYALAMGVLHLRHCLPGADLCDLQRERELLQLMVERGPLVDGVLGKPAVSVDGFAFAEYAAVLSQLCDCVV